jgi:hypothetical protein
MVKRRIVLYGKSVILGSVGASLRRYSDLEVIPLSSPFPTAQELGEYTPDVIIFDTQADHPYAAFPLLESSPGLLLIGIDPSNNQVRLWSEQQMRELSTQDLVKVIQALTGSSNNRKERTI